MGARRERLGVSAAEEKVFPCCRTMGWQFLSKAFRSAAFTAGGEQFFRASRRGSRRSR